MNQYKPSLNQQDRFHRRLMSDMINLFDSYLWDTLTGELFNLDGSSYEYVLIGALRETV